MLGFVTTTLVCLLEMKKKKSSPALLEDCNIGCIQPGATSFGRTVEKASLEQYQVKIGSNLIAIARKMKDIFSFDNGRLRHWPSNSFFCDGDDRSSYSTCSYECTQEMSSLKQIRVRVPSERVGVSNSIIILPYSKLPYRTYDDM